MIERVADPEISPRTKIVTLAVGPEDQKFLQIADPPPMRFAVQDLP